MNGGIAFWTTNVSAAPGQGVELNLLSKLDFWFEPLHDRGDVHGSPDIDDDIDVFGGSWNAVEIVSESAGDHVRDAFCFAGFDDGDGKRFNLHE